MKKSIAALSVLSAIIPLACVRQSNSLQERLTVHDSEINDVIAQMTLEEKVQMLHSKTNMSSEGVPRLDIQDIKYADGPFGIREEGVPGGFQSAGWVTDSATYFPTGSALAATWSPELAYKYGKGMGTEARKRGKDIILGPAINIQRLPVGGRTYEYLSEDPLLTAALSAQYVKGVQDAGTAACVKHFALNNQEMNRGSVDVVCDERTMREIYLKGFEAAVKDGGAMAVMPAYNKVGGFYCSENEHLLNEILRGEWGFRGLTVSDWGGTHSTMGAALHGLDVQMTGDTYLGPALIDSVKAGKVPESVIDDKVREILRVRYAVEAIPADMCNTATASQPESRETAYEVASKSIVLLKNEGGILPIGNEVKKIAVIGRNAEALTQSGGMGAGVKSVYEVTPLQGLRNRAPEGVEITYAPAYKNYLGMFAAWLGPDFLAEHPEMAASIDEAADPKMLEEAVKLAGEADLVLYFIGTNKFIESEGVDRTDIKLPVDQDRIGLALAQANPNIVCVMISGGPCELTTIDVIAPAIVQGWWNGLEGGNALADVLFGNISPSGKLPFTFPVKLEDSPAYALGNYPQKVEVEGDLFGNQYRKDIKGQKKRPMGPIAVKSTAYYSEGSLVGYRWFDTKEVPVMYAFGHGLSYVDFKYDNIRAKVKGKGDDVCLTVSFNVTNTGSMNAEEVVQLYVHRTDATVLWPYKELKAFQRTAVKAGATIKVTLELPVSELMYWDTEHNGWALEHGEVELLVGSASDDIRLTEKVKI
ncbi:MAG: glycoside hydrolase family 3 C-terminal domain-containing protein [Bacteroidales bacterium]|nr:glycoside hydrolase family 3 C-terminal domain-containing protein [Candidatus Hennigimonas equi]